MKCIFNNNNNLDLIHTANAVRSSTGTSKAAILHREFVIIGDLLARSWCSVGINKKLLGLEEFA